ncbi:hypothetical protein [Embleya sp. NBC_00896]|uniref:hypothetical protein n=1 Tax=Embleya sp. NBC_00896 TaxID=2975961 RepID=UPI002F908378|nr:hypothetical protein OG928_40930 [Embleya sp. NBC_00896]
MGDRSIRGFGLGQELTRIAGIEVAFVVDGIAAWGVEWVDGPTVDGMRAHVDAVRAGRGGFAPADHRLAFRRRQSPRAWAARAVAAEREGRLAGAVVAGAALRRGHPAGEAWGEGGLTAEEHALIDYVRVLFEVTGDPDRADRVEDEVGISRLLLEGAGSVDAMARVLVGGLGAERVRLRVVRGGPGR